MKTQQLLPILIVGLLLFMNCTGPTPGKPPNVLLICVDDLRPELKSFGSEYISSPYIDQLAQNGLSFQRHYVNAPSCGPSRYTLLTGQYGPAGNQALFQRAKRIAAGAKTVDPNMPEWFRQRGYTTVSIGKVSHHPGGLGGADWDDPEVIEMPNAWDRHLMPVGPWQHPRGAMHGLANGKIRIKASEMDVYQATPGDDDIYPDGLITEAAMAQLNQLATDEEKPFFLAVGLIRPHLPFGAPKAYLDRYQGVDLPNIPHPQKPDRRTTWHSSGEFMKYNRWGRDPNQDSVFAQAVRRHYAACVSYADTQVGKILAKLKETGADQNTIVVLWGDHGWHLGEHAIWGKHSLFEEALRSPLIITYPGMKNKGTQTKAIVETLDIFPTLCDLSGMEKPAFAEGISLKPILEGTQTDGHPALAYWGKAQSLRTDSHRLILHADGFVELYDHNSIEKETRNVAEEEPERVQEMLDFLKNKRAN